jgi:methionyl aminopeptidase
MLVRIKSEEEIDLLREGGKKLGMIINKLAKEVKPGIDTFYLEDMALRLITEAGGRPAFKGFISGSEYEPFPSALCTSINDEIVHAPAFPARILKSGDVIGIDVGMEYPIKGNGPENKHPINRFSEAGGYYTDTALTVPVGRISDKVKRLLKYTKRSLEAGIKVARPGATLVDIARAIQTTVEPQGFSIVRELVGHGVGYGVHEEPQVPNFVASRGVFPDVVLKPGMVLAIEPMVNIGGPDVRYGKDGFTIKTADGSVSAHYEHTIAITKKGVVVITEG